MKSKYIMHCYGFIQGNGRSWFPIFTIILFAILVGLAVVRLVYQRNVDVNDILAHDVAQIAIVLKQIDDTCKIIDFDNQKTNIDFLNVVKFVGSEVGAMNLAYPDNWHGPYMEKNPTLQGKEYQVVKTKKGYFIMPGEGVILSNGKVVGKDIPTDENADITAMMKNETALMYQGKALAAPLSIKHGILQDLMLENIVNSDYVVD